MRRWNGWGDQEKDYPLPPSAASYLAAYLGEVHPPADISLQEVLPSIPESRLKGLDNDSHLEAMISLEAETRLRHSHGQSLPDWIALRSGQIGPVPDGVAFPRTAEDVNCLLKYAYQHELLFIPYGGGTSVVGHINPPMNMGPVLTVDLSHLNQLEDLDEESRLATFGAGASGPQIEDQLNPLGYTLGHYPQSFEYSTLGGWIATRSSGQQSYYYGRIEDLFAGGTIDTPMGILELPAVPASAAGPDLSQLILGSEGRLGVITRATVRVRALPKSEHFYGAIFHDWHGGCEAAREIVQSNVSLSMLRLSNALETETTLMLSGRDTLVNWAQRGLNILGYGDQRTLLIYAVTGDARPTTLSRRRANSIIRSHGGLPTGSAIGNIWKKSRFSTPYLRNSLWVKGYALDTLETAVPWSSVTETTRSILKALQGSITDPGERVLAFAHLSHVYRDGASIYVTFMFPRASQPEETLRRWQRLKSAASRAILDRGGTISHQHGVGSDHARYLPQEKGPVGMDILKTIQERVDPKSLLNPGKLML
jgi:alkyldihydroxyacetonephosphate synthase